MSKLFLDLEADGLLINASTVHCIVLKDQKTSEIFQYGPDQIQEGVKHLKGADLLIGHNISLYDLPLLQRLYDLDWEDIPVADTMIWSRLLNPDRLGGHSLGAWGQYLGHAKDDFKKTFHDKYDYYEEIREEVKGSQVLKKVLVKPNPFEKYTPEMGAYCVQDVEVTETLHDHLLPKISKYSEALSLEHKFAYIISQQILNGFTLDITFTLNLLKGFKDEYTQLYNKLSETLPPIRIDGMYNTVKRDGRLIDKTADGFRYITPKTELVKEHIWKYKEANPQSRQQLVDFFITKYGWRPTKKTEKGEWAIDESVLETMPYPEAQDVKQMFYLNKKIAMIDGPGGWLKFVTPEGRVHGGMITTGAVTGRARHSKPNMANISRRRGIEMREAWVPREGWDLISCDADQLEARCLAHFTTPYDDGDLRHLILEGDLHAQNRDYCGFQPGKPGRETAKTFLYAMMYGGGNLKLGSIVASETPDMTFGPNQLISKGKKARDAISDSMYGLKALNKVLNMTLQQRDYLIGLDGRPLHIRSQHAALNTLLQSAGALIMKQCLIYFWGLCKKAGYIHSVDWGLVANVHDEAVLECRAEISQDMVQLFSEAMVLTERHFSFKCPLTAEGKIGPNWRSVH